MSPMDTWPTVVPRLFDVDPAQTDHGFCASFVCVLLDLQSMAGLSICEIKRLGVWGHEGFFKVPSADLLLEQWGKPRPGGAGLARVSGGAAEPSMEQGPAPPRLPLGSTGKQSPSEEPFQGSPRWNRAHLSCRPHKLPGSKDQGGGWPASAGCPLLL